MSTLTLTGVTKSYAGVQTLTGIDLALADGEFLVLLGPSGCGKSTLLNIIAGLIEPTSGRVMIGDRALTGVHPKDRDIAMVFQSYALYPNMTVARNIGFGLEMRRVPKAERQAAVERVAQQLQISHLLDRRPADLSGGQRQRVAIGRALVRNPAVFLFDEPLSNLDAKLRAEMRVELKRLHQTLKTTVVYVTHDQIEAMTLATRIAVMRNGQVEQFAPPAEIYDRPASLYVAGFVGSPAMNLLPGQITDGAGAGAAVTLAEGTTLPLPGAPHLPAGRPVILGIRPEDLHLIADDAAHPPAMITALIDVVEPTGPEQLLAARFGETSLTIRAEARRQITPGTLARFAPAMDRISLFDPETGLRL